MIFMCGTCGCNKKAESNIEYAANFWESDSFKDWADEEVMEHGDVSFEDWAGQELGESSHQSSGKLTFEDWADHENTELTHSSESLEVFRADADRINYLETKAKNLYLKESGEEYIQAICDAYDLDYYDKNYYSRACSKFIEEVDFIHILDMLDSDDSNELKKLYKENNIDYYRQMSAESLEDYSPEELTTSNVNVGDFMVDAGKGSYGAEFELHDWYDDMSDYGVMEMSPRIQEQKDEYLEELDLQRDAYERSKRVKNPEAMMQRRLSNINRAIGDSPQEFGMGKNYGVATAPEGKGLSGYYNSKVVKYVAIAALGFAGYKVASNR